VAALTLLTVGFTFAARPLLDVSTRAAEQLLSGKDYARAVLGAR
jgi:hypothetical protein